VVNPFDDGHSFEPFIFQGFVDSFSDSDRSVFADGPQARLDIIFSQQLSKHLGVKDMGLI